MKLPKLIFIVSLFLFCNESYSQSYFRYYGHYFHVSTPYIFQTSDNGNVIITTTVLPGTSALKLVQIIKNDSTGNTIWSKLFDDGNNGEYVGYFGLETSTGNYLFSGTWIHSGTTEYFIMMLDISGNLQWIKSYNFPASMAGIDNLFYLLETFDHGFVMSCGDHVMKVDSSGTMLWLKKYSFFPVNTIAITSRGQFIQTADSGFVFLFGRGGAGPTLNSDVYLVKTDSAGVVMWNKKFTDTVNFALTNLQETSAGYLFAKGLSLIQTDFSGDTIWTKTYDLNTFVPRISFVTKNNKIIVSTVQNISTTHDLSVFQTDSFGNVEWTKTFHENALNDFHWIQRSGNGFIITGRHLNQAYPLVMKTDSMGDAFCNTDLTLIHTIPNNISTGNDSVVANAMPLVVFNSPIPGITDSLTTGYICGGVRVDNLVKDDDLLVFPNPTENIVNIISDKSINEVIISDEYDKVISIQHQYIDLSHLSRGIYFVHIRMDDTATYIRRVIKL